MTRQQSHPHSASARSLPRLLLGLLLTSVGAANVSCQPSSSGSAAAAAMGPDGGRDAALAARMAPVDIRVARGFARLDELCWSILLEANMEMPSDNVTLLVRYDAGGLTGAGQSFTGRTGPEVIDAALAAIEGEARPVEKTTVTEAEIMALSDDLVEIKRRCWYLRVEKGGDEWTVVAKEHRAGELATSSVLARGSGLVAVFNETREKLDRKVAATPR